MRVLLIEDDVELAATLCRVLRASSMTADVAGDGRAGLAKALENDYALIVLDLMLPQIDGLRVCDQLRRHRKPTPILMITARDSVGDRVRGLETGADDYLPKPFDVREFLARARALVRRDRVVRSRHLRVGDLQIDTDLRAVTVGSKPLPLTPTEYAILEILAANVGRVVTRESLLENVWNEREPGSNKLDVAVRSLRRKLEAQELPGLVTTVYGYGYTIAGPEEQP